MKYKSLSILLLCGLLAAAASGCVGTQSPSASQQEQSQTSEETPEARTGKETSETGNGEKSESSGGLTPFTPPVSFEASTIDGEEMTSDIFSQSRLTMINVWATYCNPCLREMPGLGELVSEYELEDFQLIGIISDVMAGSDEEALENARYLIEETGASYPHLLLNESLYYGMLMDVTAVPTTFFFDSEGTLLDTVVGSMEKSDWKEKIDGLLETL